MSVTGHPQTKTRQGFGVRAVGAATSTVSRTAATTRAGVSSWSASAIGAIAATVGFIALTWWWLTQDHSIPVYDVGTHLVEALEVHNDISSGDLLGPFTYTTVYPPFGHIIGAIGMFIGGVNVTAPTVAENLVFVPILTLGCYQTAKLLYGRRAGLLAVIFALGSPLIIAQFHVFMLDAQLTALVAVSIWLILASENFKRVGVAALAGVAIGLGLLIKVQFPQFVAGLLLIALIRGGWRNYKGLAVLAVVAFAIASPWYIAHLSELGEVTEIAGANAGVPPGNSPELFTMANFTWYFWSIANSQLLAPLFALAIGGTVWTTIMVSRHRGAQSIPRESFLVGGFLAWVAVTITPHHDIRYDLELLPYLAVAGAGWIPHLPRVPRIVAVVVLVGAVAANTLGTSFGVGGNVSVALVHSPPETQAVPDRITLYSNTGFLVTGPQRDGDIPGLLRALRRNGVQVVTWNFSDNPPIFSYLGLQALALMNGLTPTPEESVANTDTQAVALVHQAISTSLPPPCVRLHDGSGVWVLRLKPGAQKLSPYCPLRTPHYYS